MPFGGQIRGAAITWLCGRFQPLHASSPWLVLFLGAVILSLVDGLDIMKFRSHQRCGVSTWYGRGDRGAWYPWSPERSAWREEKPAKKAAARSLPFSSQSCRRGETFSVPKPEPGVSPSDAGPGCGERRGWEDARAHWRSSSRAGSGADLAGPSSPQEGGCSGGPCGRYPPALPSLSPRGRVLDHFSSVGNQNIDVQYLCL